MNKIKKYILKSPKVVLSFVLGAIGTIKEVKNPYGIIAILNEVI